MKVLVADDDAISSMILSANLTKFGYQPVCVADGLEAMRVLEAPDPPPLALLDWMMPGLDGIEVCRRLRLRDDYPYVILVTSRSGKDDVITGLDAGADDFIGKPYHTDELASRLRAGERVLALKSDLQSKVRDLQAALLEVKQLQGLIPICMFCKKIRDENNVWQKLEAYICSHSQAEFSHALCKTCYDEKYPGEEQVAEAAPRHSRPS